jgi:asparagine synthase (glutamine-hydrolysing)
MCGIAGIISTDHRGAIGPMTGALAHRGPDGEGFYEDPHIALGHRRLSIIDVAGGAQPISNESGDLQLVCNGEIYNSPELRRRLTAAGHRFKSDVDVEVILHLYEEHGRDCVRHLRGMFAFALWDARRQELLLARDHMGQKPLFFARRGDEFLFASEVKAILAAGRVEPKLDVNGLWHYVSLRYLPDQYSLFRGIHKLPAASTATWRRGDLTVSRYWSPCFTDKLSVHEQELEEELHALLLETVEMHLLSDVPVGAFVSGGIDSSTVAAMMAGITREPVPAFTIGVEEQGFDELPYARMVTARYGMDAHEEVVRADLVHLLPAMIHHMDEPSDPFGVGVYLAARLAARDVKVVLSGDGGDESFAGYDRYAGQRLVDHYCLLPRWFRRSVMTRLVRRIPDSFGYKSLAQKAAWVNEMSFFEQGDRYARALSFLRFTADAKHELFTPRARAAIDDADSVGKILEHFEADNASELVDRMLYTDLMTRMPDHLLVLGDRMSMAHSLESRPVLVDHRLVEYAARLPAAMKLKGRNLKYLLKRVAARYLPAELLDRPKQGFSFPIAAWMRSDLRHFMLRLFADSRFVQLGIFDGDYVMRLVREHLDGRVDHNYRLWILINLEIWYRLFFERLSVADARTWIDELTAGPVRV